MFRVSLMREKAERPMLRAPRRSRLFPAFRLAPRPDGRIHQATFALLQLVRSMHGKVEVLARFIMRTKLLPSL